MAGGHGPSPVSYHSKGVSEVRTLVGRVRNAGVNRVTRVGSRLRFTRWCAALVLPLLVSSLRAAADDPLELAFVNPPQTARPYVWWHWMGPNFSKRGITKDLEAMREAGIGGATIFNLTSGVRESSAPIANCPWPENTYRSPAYWDALRHAAAEADRLGLELGLHNTVGYATTGGPWITQERNMQRLVSSQLTIEGGRSVNVRLAPPEIPQHSRYGIRYAEPLSWYRDIAVLAAPADGPIDDVASILDLSSRMRPDGSLSWEAPPGRWILYRLGHAPTGAQPAPAPDELIEQVLEADKMSVEQTRFHWTHVLEPLREHLGPFLGRSFRHLLIDSYEAGNQDWTPGFREEFVARKGYDPVPWLVSRLGPTSRTIGNPELTARFDYDFKEVVAELYRQNGWEVGAAMVRAAGLQLQFEPYTGPFDTVAGAALADVPMGEFWTHSAGGIDPAIVGAARAAGRRIIAAEAFTGRPENSRWDMTPAQLKRSADGFFLSGGNRLVLHHWVHQPFDDRLQPGLGMGWWGTHFGRYQTWFEPGKEFFAYLARIQAVLQRSETPVDIVSVGRPVEGSDTISVRVLLDGTTVENGRIVLPSGRRYALLAVPHDGAIEPEVVLRIGQLLEEGASVVAVRPHRSPSLRGYPACDRAVLALADRVWGPTDQAGASTARGRLFGDLGRAKRELGLEAACTVTGDAAHAVQVAHRRDPETGAEIFFVANREEHPVSVTLSCRVAALLPELWDPLDASRRPAPNWRRHDAGTEVDLTLGPLDSILLVFREKTALTGAVTRPPETLATLPVDGAWHVTFEGPVGAPASDDFPVLKSWTEHANPTIRYFSGRATYRRDLDIEPALLAPGRRLELDLGEVRDLAIVRINGRRLRPLWRAPFTVDVTNSALPGHNQLEIEVFNTWRNRLIGDEQEPPDLTWGEFKSLGGEHVAGRPLVSFPDWLVKGQPRPSVGRQTFTTWNYFDASSPLAPAGLLGPVVLRSTESRGSPGPRGR